MKRSVELEVDDLGQVTWPEGRLEMSPKVASAIAALPAQTLIQLEGRYTRPSAAPAILAVTQPPIIIAWPIDRALQARPDQLAHFRDAIERDRSGSGHALLALLAARARRVDDARAHVREALRIGMPRAAAAPFAAAWAAVQPLELSTELEDALLVAIWQDIHAWPAWVDPIVVDAHDTVVPRDRVPPPWHFGGPRVTPDYEVVAGWLVEQASRRAGSINGVGIRELRAMTDAGRSAWLRASEARDERAEAAVNRVLVDDAERAEPDISPPAGDAGPRERDQPLLAWLRYHVRGSGNDARMLARDLVRAMNDVEPRAGRAVALALDAVVILSSFARGLARRVEQVVLVHSAMRDGFAIVRAGETVAMIRAPLGAFGTWQLIEGARAVLAAIPERFVAAADAALDSDDSLACELVADPVARRRRRTKPTPAPVSEPEPPREHYVHHATFGRGRVIERVADGPKAKLVVEFDDAGRKVVLERFVTLDQSL